MKFTHNLPYHGKKLSYKYDKENRVVTYKYKGVITSIYNCSPFCIEDEIKKDIIIRCKTEDRD